MREQLELSNGAVAKFRKVEDIPERLRRPITKCLSRLSPDAMEMMEKLKDHVGEDEEGNVIINKSPEELANMGLKFNENDLDQFSQANDYCILALVKEWTATDEAGAVLPLTMDGVLSLRGGDYDRLRAATAPAVGSLFVNFSVDGARDATSPFGSSSTSENSSKGTPSLTTGSP